MSVELRQKVLEIYPASSFIIANETNAENNAIYFVDSSPAVSLDYFKFIAETPLQITTANPVPNQYLLNSSISMDFTTNFPPNVTTASSCTITDQSIFLLQMSDAQGKFTNPTTFGSLIINDASGDTAGTFSISGIIPSTVNTGTGFIFRVIRQQIQRSFAGNCQPTIILASTPFLVGTPSSASISIQCPNNITINTQIGSNSGIYTQQAQAISDNSTVMNGTSVLFKVGKSVTLQPGFAANGGNFRAEINGCQ